MKFAFSVVVFFSNYIKLLLNKGHYSNDDIIMVIHMQCVWKLSIELKVEVIQ